MTRRQWIFILGIFFSFPAWADCLMDAPMLLERVPLLHSQRINQQALLRAVQPFKKSPALPIANRAAALELRWLQSEGKTHSELPFLYALCQSVGPDNMPSLLLEAQEASVKKFFDALAEHRAQWVDKLPEPDGPLFRSVMDVTQTLRVPRATQARWAELERQAAEIFYPQANRLKHTPPMLDFSPFWVATAGKALTMEEWAWLQTLFQKPTWRAVFSFAAKRRVSNLEGLLKRAEQETESLFPRGPKALSQCLELLQKTPMSANFWNQYGYVCSELFVIEGLHEAAWNVATAVDDAHRFSVWMTQLQRAYCPENSFRFPFCRYAVADSKMSKKDFRSMAQPFLEKRMIEAHGFKRGQALSRAFWARFETLWELP